jgi:hypothetical protein
MCALNIGAFRAHANIDVDVQRLEHALPYCRSSVHRGVPECCVVPEC